MSGKGDRRKGAGLTALIPGILKTSWFNLVFWGFCFRLVPFQSLPCHCNHSLLFCHKQEHYGRDKSKDFQIFGSPHGKDLLFKDAAQGFLKIPSKIDSWMYLGYEYVTAIRNLREETRKYREGSHDLRSVETC